MALHRRRPRGVCRAAPDASSVTAGTSRANAGRRRADEQPLAPSTRRPECPRPRGHHRPSAARPPGGVGQPVTCRRATPKGRRPRRRPLASERRRGRGNRPRPGPHSAIRRSRRLAQVPPLRRSRGVRRRSRPRLHQRPSPFSRPRPTADEPRAPVAPSRARHGTPRSRRGGRIDAVFTVRVPSASAPRARRGPERRSGVDAPGARGCPPNARSCAIALRVRCAPVRAHPTGMRWAATMPFTMSALGTTHGRARRRSDSIREQRAQRAAEGSATSGPEVTPGDAHVDSGSAHIPTGSILGAA